MLPIRNDIIKIKCGKEIVATYEVLAIDDKLQTMTLRRLSVDKESSGLDEPKEVTP